MITPKRSTRLALALIPFLAGCVGPSVHWGVPTVYDVHDLGPESAVRAELRNALRGDKDPFGFIEESSGTPYRFRLNGVQNMNQLVEVQRTINAISKKHKVPVDLTTTVLTFQSAYIIKPERVITLKGEATPGSTVYLDTGLSAPIVIENIGNDGRWEKSVLTGPSLKPREGWIYLVVRKGDTRLFIRTNLLDLTVFEPISLEQLPNDSPLRTIPQR